jgi:hypothetical protein
VPIDFSTPADTPKTPPRKTPARKPALSAPVSRMAGREEALTGVGKITSLLLAMRGGYADAGAIAQHGPPIAHEAAALAETDTRIASWIDYLTEAGPYMGLTMAILPLAMQLAANHGRLDASKLPPESGVVSPGVLEARVKADMETTRLQFLKAAQEAQNQADAAARELASVNGGRDAVHTV